LERWIIWPNQLVLCDARRVVDDQSEIRRYRGELVQIAAAGAD